MNQDGQQAQALKLQLEGSLQHLNACIMKLSEIHSQPLGNVIGYVMEVNEQLRVAIGNIRMVIDAIGGNFVISPETLRFELDVKLLEGANSVVNFLQIPDVPDLIDGMEEQGVLEALWDPVMQIKIALDEAQQQPDGQN